MVVHAYYPLGETRVQREAEALTARGFEVDVLCLREPGAPRRERHGDVTVRRLPVRRHREHGMVVQLLEYLHFATVALLVLSWLQLRRRYGSVQVHAPPDFLVGCALIPKLVGVPVVLDVHDLTPELFAARREGTSPGVLDRAVAWQERWACGFADHVITVTPRWRERLIARGVAPDRVSVTLNVADTRRFTPATSATSTGDDRFRVVYHGTLTERYGVDVLLEAVATLVPDLPQLQLRVLGDGDARSRLLQRAEELGLDGHVSFSPGMVDVDEVVGEVRRADVGVVPNRRNAFTDELLPTKLLEYVAVGVPVVASRTPALEDHLDEGMVEFVTAGDPRELADRLLELHRDPERRRQLVREADAFHRRHGWDAVAATYVALIERLTIEAEVRR